MVKLSAVVPPIICLVSSLVAVASISKPIPFSFWVVGALTDAAVIGFSAWAAHSMKVEVVRDISSRLVKIRAPFYSRSFSHKSISDISTGEDSGMNSGLINWPVTGSASSEKGVRINLGGAAHVKFLADGKHRFTIVTTGMSQAKRLAALLSSN
ncbi:hypothetical protein [Corynebacterium sp. TAE3-ERU16]|uniref:hypothetical protein n=1 Tax=Corynebacterium sp. TAE3-ERU16 TaxID=2849493 RepID=UPI001C475DAF|nr:hypothetical protein [Corynebacterium sp. TAE3-ERU16]MBV7293697.1 hypothetical protein [Corynebacterium sp. TAE3-ERU16]